MKRTCLVFMCLTVLFWGNLTSAQGSADANQKEKDNVRAKIGIQVKSQQTLRRAKASERVEAGDYLRIYIIPEFAPFYIYVIYNNQETVVQLYDREQPQTLNNVPVILPPSEQEFYKIDGRDALEQLTIICSPGPLAEIEDFFKDQEQTPEKWREIEQLLVEKSRFDLSDTISRPWSIAGTVRAAEIPDPFLEELLIFSGNTLVLKKYEFRVEK